MSTKGLIHTLDNGLVLLGESLQAAESAAFTLRVPAGCVYEPQDRAGLAMLTCELALRGCGTRDNRQFVEALENLGVERGESVFDAHASFSGATLAENLLPALSIYADLVQRPLLPADELDACRLTVEQDLSAVEDEPAQKVMLELRRLHYPDPWGRPPQGSQAGIAATTIDDIRQYTARNFRAGGAVLGVAGRFDWDALRSEVDRLFGSWQTGTETPLIEHAENEPFRHFEHDSNQTQIALAYPSAAYRDPDYFQAWGAVGVLSGGMSSRLFTEVREKRGLCYSVHASLGGLPDRGSIFCYAGTSAERAQETLDVTWHELERLTQGIEPRELERLRARMKSALVMQQESSIARSGALVRDWHYLGQVRSLAEIGAAIDALSADSINAYLASHPPRDHTVVTVGPRPLEVPRGVS